MVGRTSRVTKAPTRFQDDDDFYLIKFVEDNVRIVLSSDKVKIKDEDVEAGSACEAYWEDTQIKGWFPAIILAFGEYTSEEKPPPGIYSESDAQKYKMVEVYKGSGVFWYLGNRHSALNSTKTAGELTAYLMDTFFSKETMAASNMNGGGKKGYQKLNPTIINAMRGFVLDDSHYGKQAGIIFNKTVQDKCCGARRGVSKGLTD